MASRKNEFAAHQQNDFVKSLTFSMVCCEDHCSAGLGDLTEKLHVPFFSRGSRPDVGSSRK